MNVGIGIPLKVIKKNDHFGFVVITDIRDNRDMGPKVSFLHAVIYQWGMQSRDVPSPSP